MKLPHGRLLRSRVVSDPGTVLSSALDAELTGYARLQPQDALLLDADGVGVLTFEEGVPVAAYHTASDSSGSDAVSAIAVSGPFRVELYELDGDVLTELHDTESFTVPPGLPAEQLAGDPSLVERTREAAPDSRVDASSDSSQSEVVESFLDDQTAVEAVQDRARTEALERADSWGFDVSR
ncbi:hypothetical protein [Halovenus marina]|uniref:hypothetical protein n=1 Tax=Halovenus marina TaxID=3396621 RepID=UPI003F57CA39